MSLSMPKLNLLTKLSNDDIVICPFDYPSTTALLDYLCEMGYAFKQPFKGQHADIIDDWLYKITQAGERYLLELNI